MNNNGIRTFFNFPFNEAKTAAELLAIAARIPKHAKVYVLQDSNQSVHPHLKEITQNTGGRLLRIRTSGPWNNCWRVIQQIEAEAMEGMHDAISSIWFLSLIPSTEIGCALKRHRTIHNLTNREAYFLATLRFGEEHDEIVALTLDEPMGYLTTSLYKDLTTQELFDLTSFEGQRFLRPVHDVDTCAQIMGHYTPAGLGIAS